MAEPIEHIDFKLLLQRLSSGVHLGEDDAFAAVSAIMAGQASEPVIAAFLTAIAIKGETEDELVGAARAMRHHLVPLRHDHTRVLDTCGTGGDLADTFNISTTVAFVCAAAGVPVAKHGNRSASSRVGSADVLEAAGVRLELSPDKAADLFAELGYCFLFAPAWHQAMRHAAPVRRQLGFRTIFNLLGPLSNPAGATHQLLGIHDLGRVGRMAAVLGRLGATRVLVAHGAGGLDEIALSGSSHGVLNDRGTLQDVTIDPEALGFELAPITALRGGDAADNAKTMLAILGGEPGPKADIVAINAGVALWAAEATPDLPTAITLSRNLLKTGAAAELFFRYRDRSLAS